MNVSKTDLLGQKPNNLKWNSPGKYWVTSTLHVEQGVDTKIQIKGQPINKTPGSRPLGS